MDKYHIGSTNFNAQDRLSILNLIDGITIYYDDYENGLQNYIDCYTEDGLFILKIPGKDPQYVYKNPESGQNGMKEFFGERIADFIAQAKQNRHNYSNKVIIEQTDHEAKAIVNLIFVCNQHYDSNQGPVGLINVQMSAQYDISFRKHKDRWLVHEMIANVDNTFS
ncbi:MAG: nuclear transport factor 2 family protein [Marinoscillum sp.]